jgi:hypothetical protein
MAAPWTIATARCCGSRPTPPPSRFPSRRRESRQERGHVFCPIAGPSDAVRPLPASEAHGGMLGRAAAAPSIRTGEACTARDDGRGGAAPALRPAAPPGSTATPDPAGAAPPAYLQSYPSSAEAWDPAARSDQKRTVGMFNGDQRYPMVRITGATRLRRLLSERMIGGIPAFGTNIPNGADTSPVIWDGGLNILRSSICDVKGARR